MSSTELVLVFSRTQDWFMSGTHTEYVRDPVFSLENSAIPRRIFEESLVVETTKGVGMGHTRGLSSGSMQ